MGLPNTRTNEEASIIIDTINCTGCGLCVDVCKDFNLEIINGKVSLTEQPIFGCFACGHCTAICKNGCIEISGRCLSPKDIYDLDTNDVSSDYPSIFRMMQNRRSIREFRQKAIEKEKIDQIINAAMTAPMGLPPSDVRLLVIDGLEKVRDFSFDFANYLKSLRWMTSAWFGILMKPFWGKANDELLKQFIKPLLNTYIERMDQGEDMITYSAPLAIYFYGSPYSDPADPIVAATYAMLAGESLGLGTCMLGAIHPFIQSGRLAKKFRTKHNIRNKSKEGIFVIFGYPRMKYSKGIKRTFAEIDYL